MNTPLKLAKAVFFRVKNNTDKIHLICMKAQEAYMQEKRLLIAVPNLQAAQYIDALLWRMPEESFIPHAIIDFPTSEWIAITQQDQCNVNQAPRLLNLCLTPTPLYGQVEEIFEILDETHPEKAELSQKRLRFYEEKGLFIQ